MGTRRELLALLAAWGAVVMTPSARAATPEARGPRGDATLYHATPAGASVRDPASADAVSAEATLAARRPSPSASLAAAWDVPAGHRVGILAAAVGALRVETALAVPTRAHGLLAEPGGSLLAVARRPGDWLLRFGRDGRRLAEHWIEPDRAFNGHLLASADGRLLYGTETDLESGAGLIGVRDAATLERLASWPTHGLDPHELLWDADGTLLVANGGIPTQPETGRAKRGLERMDPSLVRLDPAGGRLLGQWRLADPRLSVRHLARQGGRTAIALQAEHDDPARRAAAPVLALFDGARLRPAEAPRALAGYGGSVAGASGLFFVGCPRVDGTACWDAEGAWLGFQPLAEACPLASAGTGVWAGGLDRGRWTPAEGRAGEAGAASSAGEAPAHSGMRLDNHWIAIG